MGTHTADLYGAPPTALRPMRGEGITSVSVDPDAVDAARHVIAAAERHVILEAAR